MYDWATDPGALAPGTEVADRLLAHMALEFMEYLESRGLADDYRAWRRAR